MSDFSDFGYEYQPTEVDTGDEQRDEIEDFGKTEVLSVIRSPSSILGFLVIIESPDQNIRLAELEGDAVVIGRSADCDITIRDKSISRQHAQIQRVEQGEPPHFFIRDLNSGNGVIVNEEEIEEHILEDGDFLQLGESDLVFKQILLKRKEQ